MAAPKGNQYAVGNSGGNGAPPKYEPRFVKMAKLACERGFTDYELAQLLEVSEVTINNWKLQHEEFALALKAGKDACDERVVKSLYHKAVGYTFKSEKIFNYEGEIIRADTIEHNPPDTGAAIFWLKNRRAKEWKDMRQMEVGGPGDFDAMTDDELALEMERRSLLVDVTPKGK